MAIEQATEPTACTCARESIGGLLARLDESVERHQRWNRLIADVRAMRAEELALDNDRARSAAAAYARVLIAMGAWDE